MLSRCREFVKNCMSGIVKAGAAISYFTSYFTYEMFGVTERDVNRAKYNSDELQGISDKLRTLGAELHAKVSTTLDTEDTLRRQVEQIDVHTCSVYTQNILKKIYYDDCPKLRGEIDEIDDYRIDSLPYNIDNTITEINTFTKKAADSRNDSHTAAHSLFFIFLVIPGFITTLQKMPSDVWNNSFEMLDICQFWLGRALQVGGLLVGAAGFWQTKKDGENGQDTLFLVANLGLFAGNELTAAILRKAEREGHRQQLRLFDNRPNEQYFVQIQDPAPAAEAKAPQRQGEPAPVVIPPEDQVEGYRSPSPRGGVELG
jgi:hypothetical protein